MTTLVPITPIPTTPKPPAVPSLWNERYDEIMENLERLNEGKQEAGSYLTIAAAAATYLTQAQGSSRPGHAYTATDWAWLDKPGGLIFQWGEFTLAATAGSSFSVTLPAAYSALHIASWIGVDNASTDAVGVINPTLTGLFIQKGTQDPSLRTGNWFSIGR